MPYDKEEESAKIEKQETKIINNMMSYVNKQINKGILYGEASKTMQLDGEDDLKVINASWVADGKERSSKRKIQVSMKALSQEDIENKLSKSTSSK
jgi:hypothetical protein